MYNKQITNTSKPKEVPLKKDSGPSPEPKRFSEGDDD